MAKRSTIIPLFFVLVMAVLSGCGEEESIYCPDYEGYQNMSECQEPYPDPESDELEEMGYNLNGTEDEIEFIEASEIEETASKNLTLPAVGIFVSDYSREGWNIIGSINYFQAYTALEEILDSHKIPFVEIEDSDLEEGILMIDNETVRFPIVFSFSNRVISPKQSERIREYVQKGGNILFNGNSLTKLVGSEQGEGENCFVLPEINLRCVEKVEGNWFFADTIERKKSHDIVKHIPRGKLAWRIWRYDIFLVEPTGNAVEIISSSRKGERKGANLVLTEFGNGSFIYMANVVPLWGRYEGEPGLQAALIVLNSIRWAFERSDTPFIEMKPWGEYDAAFMLRFDVETTKEEFIERFPKFVDIVRNNNETATFYILVDQEKKGKPDKSKEYYRADFSPFSRMLREARDKGALIESHSTWHLGPDFDGNEGIYNIKYSLDTLEKVLGKRPQHWVAPAFGANLDSSLQKTEALGIKTTGDQRIGYLPHFSLSPDIEGKHYGVLQIPTIDYYNPDFMGGALMTSLEHHNLRTIDEIVDFYYDKGGIINLYAHLEPGNDMKLERLISHVQAKENVWHTTPQEVLDYWTKRSKLDYEGISYMDNKIKIRVKNNFEGVNGGVLRLTLPKDSSIKGVRYGNILLKDFSTKNGFLDIEFQIMGGSEEDIVVELG